MQLRFTSNQVPRRARADAETTGKIVLIKMVSLLRATYQIRLLAFRAYQEHLQFELYIPKRCRFDVTLNELMRKLPNVIQIKRI